MRWRDALRTVLWPYGRRWEQPPGDFCGLPPWRSVRPRERQAVKAGDACTSCGHPLEAAAGLRESARVEGAAWWCRRCGTQFREIEPGG
ncbi:MAG TPA: hypothetical protein VII06_28185 [Chloroflexota bacterium]|jgi:hypothetical protein